MPPLTVAMRLRRAPRATAVLLGIWLSLLLVGQLATTLWWLLQFSLLNLLSAVLLLGCLVLGSLVALTPLQVVATSLSLVLTGLMVLNVYSAVSLFVPPGIALVGTGCHCWEVLHVPTFVFLALTYLAEALPPLLKAEYGEVQRLRPMLRALARTSSLAQYGCAAAVALYLLVAIVVGNKRLCALTGYSAQCAVVGPLDGRGLVLSLHALGLLCVELWCFTVATYSEDLLRILLVLGQALVKRLRGPLLARAPPQHEEVFRKILRWFDDELQRLQSPADRMNGRLRAVAKLRDGALLWTLLEEIVPTLRRAAPPKHVVKLLFMLRRMAPLLAPASVFIVQLERSGWPRTSLLLVQALLVMGWRFMKEAHLTVPESSLQRLALLVPNFYIDPSTRTMLGYSLSTVKHVRRSSRGVAMLLRLPRRLLGLALQPVARFF